MEYGATVKYTSPSTSRLSIPSQVKFSGSQSQRSHVYTTRDTTRAIRTSEATSDSLRQTCSAVTAAYDAYIQLMDILPDYQELRMGLVIERYRTDPWRRFVLAKAKIGQGDAPAYEIGLWAVFEYILTKMLETFSEIQRTMEEYAAHADDIKLQEDLSDALQFASLQPGQRSHEASELPETMSTATKSPPEHSFMKSRTTLNYGPLGKKHIERILQTLCYWNDSLDGLTPLLERESSRRRLRAHLSTSNIAELKNLEAAAAFLKHQDIERMAHARSVVEQEEYVGLLGLSQLQASENLSSPPPPEYRLKADNLPSSPPPEYRLNPNELEWQESPYSTDRIDRANRTRAMATLRGESVIVDWQYCEDDSWRRAHRAAFRRRTENLTTILNTGLRPLNLSVLHCVGYLERGSNTTGYAFRLPPGVEPGQRPVTLHHLLDNVRKGDDVPDLGERFQLAKALVSTVFEIHNLGWLHKNIQPKNILFWPKPNSTATFDISKPYLMGFDISRPNQPGELTEMPLACPGDDLYRHPLYRSTERHSFQPSFDIYSLGIVLYEIGFWRSIAVSSHAATGKSRLPLTPPNSNSQGINDLKYIDALVKDGSVGGLKRFMGRKYRDVVLACLQRTFDEVWEKQEGDRENRLHAYLDLVQSKIVDAINICSA